MSELKSIEIILRNLPIHVDGRWHWCGWGVYLREKIQYEKLIEKYGKERTDAAYVAAKTSSLSAFHILNGEECLKKEIKIIKGRLNSLNKYI